MHTHTHIGIFLYPWCTCLSVSVYNPVYYWDKLESPKVVLLFKGLFMSVLICASIFDRLNSLLFSTLKIGLHSYISLLCELLASRKLHELNKIERLTDIVTSLNIFGVPNKKFEMCPFANSLFNSHPLRLLFLQYHQWVNSNLLSFLHRCGTRPYERGNQRDSNSLLQVCLSLHYPNTLTYE